ncbi:hypothetical protein M569_08486, partial [Genlisea aurea]
FSTTWASTLSVYIHRRIRRRQYRRTVEISKPSFLVEPPQILGDSSFTRSQTPRA